MTKLQEADTHKTYTSYPFNVSAYNNCVINIQELYWCEF